MPFTLSHAAASLPFRRFKPVWPALVIGTFAPDLQYFIAVSNEDRSGHHFPAVLLFTTPFALFVLWLFEGIVKGPVIALLPSGVQRRLQDKLEPLSFRGWRRLASIVLWVAVGIATHLIWDQFTHSYSELAIHWDLLRAPVSLPSGHRFLLAHLLQHISTILGMAALPAWFTAWYSRTPPAPPWEVEFSPRLKIALTLAMAVIAAAMGYPITVVRLAGHAAPVTMIVFLVTVLEAATLIFCIELLIFGLALTLNGRLRHVPATQMDEPRA